MNARTSCLGDFARYTSLNVLGMIALSCYILADTFFVSLGMGADGLAALNLAIPVYSFIHGSGLMIGMGGGTRYSIRKNQGDGASANRAFTSAICLAAGFAAVFFLIGLLLPGPLARLLGADGAVYAMTRTYLQVILLFAPAFLTNNLLLCFVRNDGAPQLAMAGMITGSLSNVVLDYVFIFPCGMGIFGAALATGFAPLISMAVLSPYLIRGKNRFRPVRCHLRPRRLAAICSAGVPSLVTEVSSGVVMIAFNAILLRLEGNVGVAAYGVIANLSLMVLSIFTGISQGIQPLLSARYGAGKKAELAGVLHFLNSPTPGWSPFCEVCSAHTGMGVHEAWDMLCKFKDSVGKSGYMAQRRAEQKLEWFKTLLEAEVLREFHKRPNMQQTIEHYKKLINSGAITVATAVKNLMEKSI